MCLRTACAKVSLSQSKQMKPNPPKTQYFPSHEQFSRGRWAGEGHRYLRQEQSQHAGHARPTGITSKREQETGTSGADPPSQLDLQTQGLHGPQHELKASPGNLVRLCPETNSRKGTGNGRIKDSAKRAMNVQVQVTAGRRGDRGWMDDSVLLSVR